MAPAAASTVDVLGDDLLQEVFVLLPAPADLLRAALACRPFLRAARSAAFLRRFRRRHPFTCPLLLGCHLHRPGERRGNSAPHLLPAPPAAATRRVAERGDFALSFIPRRGRPGAAGAGTPWQLLDCRNGRLLLRSHSSSQDLVVADPLARRWVSLPALPGDHPVGYALVADDSDYSVFEAACISRVGETTELRAFLLSSGDLRWADVGGLAQQPNLAASRAMQANRTLYWKLTGGSYKTALKSKSSLNEVNQVAQLRIIIKPKSCNGVGPLCTAQQICYHVLGLVHGIWTPIPQAVKDYIATPKPNGYQSLHTTVIPFLNESMFHLEVQIRTEDMDLIAERGIAAHYSGRGVVSGPVRPGISSGRNLDGKVICLNNTGFALRIGWLNAIREWQEEFVGNMSSREFVDTITRDLLGSRVFVFTPKGEIKNLPKGATVIDYAYLIHTEIGNKMVAAKVNGNLVSPIHALANAEVVEIITYDKLSNKYAFQRHQQWLQHAKTRSARHKIMKFLREQAALSAAEITADAVNNFVADLEDESDSEQLIPTTQNEDYKFNWQKILSSNKLSFVNKSSDGFLPINNVHTPKINGKHNKAVKELGIKINGSTVRGDSSTEFMRPGVPACKEVFASLDNWKCGKISSWHNTEGNSIQWLCIVCVDRKGMMAEVTSALTACGITICSCVAERDNRRGMGVLLFHFEGTDDNVVSACSSVEMILGVLGWSAGCSYNPPGVLEC